MTDEQFKSWLDLPARKRTPINKAAFIKSIEEKILALSETIDLLARLRELVD